MIHPVWPERSGEESGAGSSPGLQPPSALPAMAPPQCHFTSDRGPHPTQHCPLPTTHISLVSSKLLQSAQTLIGLGQVSAVHFNHGAGTCQIIPSVLVCDCVVAERLVDLRFLCVNTFKSLVRPKLQISIFSHLSPSSHANSLGCICL